jgi:shikimate kinase
MGAGKSTIGRLLAKELRLPFKDSDKEIEQRTGADIPWIFDVEGEQGFRDREQAVIAELCEVDGMVLATGGGAVMRAENRAALRGGGRVVYLHASVEQQVDRTSRDRNRPLLRSPNPGKVLADLLAIRDPLYREIADVVVETDERPPRMVVQRYWSASKRFLPVKAYAELRYPRALCNLGALCKLFMSSSASVPTPFISGATCCAVRICWRRISLAGRWPLSPMKPLPLFIWRL